MSPTHHPQARRARRALAALLASACVTALSLATPTLAHAVYPDHPITMIVAYGAGGGTDLTARAIAPFIEKHLGNQARILVVNRTGAGGAIGFSALANAPADGYTIGFINTPNVLTIPIERKVDFNWQRYDLLGNLVDDPSNFAVRNDSPVRNLADLAALVKANPGTVTVGTTGTGSDDHLAMLMFEKAIGGKMIHVPYKGSSDVRAATQGGQIAVAAINVGEALQAIQSGTPLRNLGSMSQQRTSLAPQLATFREQGYDIELASLRGLAAPKGLPPELRAQLIKAIAAAAADPEFQVKATQIFAPMRYLAPPAYEAALVGAEARFQSLWKEVPWSEK